MAEPLKRIEFTGEVPGPGAEIIVVNDDHAEIDDTASDNHESLVVKTRAIADIAIMGFVAEGHRESGFTGIWTSRVEPDSPPIPIRLVGSRNGQLRVLADSDDPSHAKVTDTSGVNRYYIRLAA